MLDHQECKSFFFCSLHERIPPSNKAGIAQLFKNGAHFYFSNVSRPGEKKKKKINLSLLQFYTTVQDMLNFTAWEVKIHEPILWKIVNNQYGLWWGGKVLSFCSQY